MTVIAEWRGATKRYANVTAVQDVSLSLQAGEATALIGHNGAGKTTLIKLLLGLIRPSSGTVSVAGVDPAGSGGSAARRSLGFLPENVAFHGAMTGAELMSFYARLKGHSPSKNAALLERVGISGAAHRRIATYSKGMRQRLGIAQALIGEPRLLLFDEPTSGLDPASRIDVFDMIDTLRGSGATVLVSTHALAEVEHRVDRVAVMHEGQLRAAGALEELRSHAVAGVRMQLRVRHCTTERVLERLGPEVRCVERSAETLTLQVPPQLKMAVLQSLSGLGEIVQDIEMSTLGLEQLYRDIAATPPAAP